MKLANTKPAVHIIRRFTREGSPIVPVAALTTTEFSVCCPLCGGAHWYSRGSDLYGPRVTRCAARLRFYALPPTTRQIAGVGR